MNNSNHKICIITSQAFPNDLLQVDRFDHKFDIQAIQMPSTLEALSDLVFSLDRRCDVLVLDGISSTLALVGNQVAVGYLNDLESQVKKIIVVDGHNIRQAVECWSFELLNQWHPGLFRRHFRVLVKGLLNSLKHIILTISNIDKLQVSANKNLSQLQSLAQNWG